MAQQTYQIVLNTKGVRAFIMPEGFFSNVEIHCWGAGGGKGRGANPGGGGGYAKTITTVNEGDEVVFQIGQPGTDGGYPAGGVGGVDPAYRLFRGGNSSSAYDEDADTGAGGGGGGASWVSVEGTVVCCGAGGGGGSGYGEDNSGRQAGFPGGVTTNGLNTRTTGGDTLAGWATGGGGGGGYPFGGLAGYSVGDDNYSGPTGGSGGQNYGDVTVAGSGTMPGGRTVSYYPGNKVGEVNYPGYIVIVLTKKFNAWIKNPDSSGDWIRLTSAYTKLPTRNIPATQVYPQQTIEFTVNNTWTVPPGVTSIAVRAIGGGGGGGGADGGAAGGYPNGGYPGSLVTATIAVSPGQILSMNIGQGGGGGAGRASSAAPGAGGAGYYAGGRGGYAGPSGSSGAGGGGGGATAILINSTPVIVAGGGGGAGGSGNGNYGVASIGTFNSTTAGAQGQNKSGDGGGGGGGGGGYPFGGAGGPTRSGDAGAYSGTTGQSLVPAGGSVTDSNNGGGYISGLGGQGRVLITFTRAPDVVITKSGGWKQIQNAFVKESGTWKPFINDEPVALYDWPIKRRSANISIVADTNDYNLYDNLPIQYFEGIMDVTVTVYPNTTIRGSSISTAFTINQFTSGDTVTLYNHGRIQGRGGAGGAGGYRYSYTSGKNTLTATAGAAAGGAGGTGLLLQYPATVINSGNIAGGGGGGGGGGITSSGGKSPTYTGGGRGGGGAGFGVGANNGTLTSGGAGATFGGTGGGRGVTGDRGGNGGAAGGAGGYAIVGALLLSPQSNIGNVATGTIVGPIAS